MIVEYVQYELPDNQCAAFEAAYRRVGGLLGASPHCLGWELRRGVEDPGHYMVRIEWDSLDGHVRGWRESEPFQHFFREVNVFVEYRRRMTHFELV